jgi:3-deoxy-D-manno-octulosonic-acid transferase
LDAAHGAQSVADEEALVAGLEAWFADPAARQAAADAAATTIKKLGGALDRTWGALDPYLIQLRLEETA